MNVLVTLHFHNLKTAHTSNFQIIQDPQTNYHIYYSYNGNCFAGPEYSVPEVLVMVGSGHRKFWLWQVQKTTVIPNP